MEYTLMKAFFKYLIFLAAISLVAVNLYSQEDEKFRKLKELKQLEKGYVEVDEVDPIHIIGVPQVQDILVLGYSGSTKINIRKKLNDLTMSGFYRFNVDEDYNGIDVYLRGEVKQGSFSIKVIKPDKTVLKEVTLTPGQSQDWHQSYLLDKEKKTGIGKWTVQLSASNATGYYQFISTTR
jgi:hypothetical protein